MLKIITHPNHILSTKTHKVAHINESVLKLIEIMRVSMHKNKGVGLSANQIGKNLSIAVIENTKVNNPDESIPMHVLINPKIIKKTTPYQAIEGCLSLPNLEFKVERFENIEYYNTNLDNVVTINKANGFFAQVIQHEVDHLEGKLICEVGTKNTYE